MNVHQGRHSDLVGSDAPKTLNVGVIGCGRIAEHQLRFIERTEGARLTALSDPILANARRFAERYGVEEIYSSHQEMLRSSSLDVVHILTPPEFHYSQAVDAIEHGVHVLLEKPCTIHPYELEDLYRRAAEKGVRLCPDFMQIFHPTFVDGAAVIDSGQLGKVVHVEIHLSVDLNTPDLRESIGLPWRFNLPGGILHDNITHPLYMALRWLGEPEKVTVFSQSHGVLPQRLIDHLSILLAAEGRTANILFSAVIKPEPYHVHVFCERGNVLINFDTSAILVTRNSNLPRSVRRATANFTHAYQLFAWGTRNLVRFARGRLQPYQGIANLIQRFYDCIRNGSEIPISKELAISVARTEAEIFSQAGKLHLETSNRPSTQKSITRGEKVLVTGATGYLGSVVVQHLVKEGYYVRALVRELSHTERLEKLGIELVYGDVRNADSMLDACKDMDIVIHMAAALTGTASFMLDCAIKGTKNVAVAAKEWALKRVIYISSMSVYDSLALQDSKVISEDSPLEESAHLRGTYSLAKRGAEDEAVGRLRDDQPGWTILRPSVIVGHNGDGFSPIGKKIGNLAICTGSSKRLLRLIHVDDVAAAIVKLIQNVTTQGRVFNISAEGITQREYIDEFIRKSGHEHIRVIYIPYWLARCAAGALSSLRFLSRRIPNIDKRRLASLYQNSRVDSSAIKAETGWHPGRNLLEILLSESLKANKGAPGGLPPEEMAELAAIGK